MSVLREVGAALARVGGTQTGSSAPTSQERFAKGPMASDCQWRSQCDRRAAQSQPAIESRLSRCTRLIRLLDELVNPRDTILKAADGLKSHTGRLTCDRLEDSSALATANMRCRRPFKTSQARIGQPFHPPASPLTAHVVPISTNSVWKGFAPPSGVAAMFVIDPLVRCANADALAEAYDLTAAECRVLREVVQGSGLVDTARTLRVAVSTARRLAFGTSALPMQSQL